MSKKMANQFASSRLILPEHGDRLRNRYRGRQKEEECRLPCLDQQMWEEFEVLVERSLQQGLALIVTTVNRWGRYRVMGRVVKVDPVNKRMTLATPEGARQPLALPEIIGIEEAL